MAARWAPLLAALVSLGRRAVLLGEGERVPGLLANNGFRRPTGFQVPRLEKLETPQHS